MNLGQLFVWQRNIKLTILPMKLQIKNSYYEIHKNTLPMFYDYNIKFPKKINKLKILKKKRDDKFVNKDPIFLIILLGLTIQLYLEKVFYQKILTKN